MVFMGISLYFSVHFDFSYLTHRLGKIRMLKWEAGAVLPDKIKHNTLSAREKEYFMAYGGVIADYSDQVGIDLSMDIEVGLFCNRSCVYLF